MPQTPQRSVFTFSLISLLISYTLLRLYPSISFHLLNSPQNQTLALPTPTASELYTNGGSHDYQHLWRQESCSRNYIVRFYHYKEAEDLRNYLQNNVKFKGWEWIERKTPAARFPTDFGLVAIEESVKELLLENFRKLDLVKDVSLDLSYQRVVLEEKNEKIGAFIDGNKTAGKIFTAMSFSEDQNYAVDNTSNMKISWKRELLMQKSQVTSLFGAESLWSRGYTGAKVKMAIFDTVNEVMEIHSLVNILGGRIGVLPTVYLGMPLGAKSKSKGIWNGVVEKCEKKLDSRKSQYLSLGGRLTLINGLLDALPTYMMSLFPMPATVVKRLDALRRIFLWRATGEKSKIHLVGWDIFTTSMKEGGMGIRNLKILNQGLMMKWLWSSVKYSVKQGKATTPISREARSEKREAKGPLF